MPKKEKKEQTTKKNDGALSSVVLLRAVVIPVVGIVVLACIAFGASLYIDQAYAGRIFPGVFIGSLDLTGATLDEAETILESRISAIDASGITAKHQDKEVVIDSTVAAKSEIDAAFPLFTFDVDAALQEAYTHGRNGNGLQNSYRRLLGLAKHYSVVPVVSFETDRFQEVLRAEFQEFETPAKNAKLIVNQDGTFGVEPSANGVIFPYEDYTMQAISVLQNLDSPVISLALAPDIPLISDADAQSMVTAASVAYGKAPMTLTWEDKSWEVSKEQVANSITVSKPGGAAELAFAAEGFQSTIDAIRGAIDIEAQNSRFTIQDGKVAEFQNSKKGRTVDIDALLLSMNAQLSQEAFTPIALVVKDVEPDVTESDADDLGITELVASATTNFRGSPTNRRKNIANGVRLINGTLIKPGETFSTVKALSPIEISNGFYSELVIKGNRTIPEVGGGLCQVSTTLFRTALVGGLPIEARTNHSYRVSYYEPPVGMDATIYDPAPDFKFKNDYGSYLLLLGHVDGDNITFELWGTKDGRVAETSEPRMYNVTVPGPTKYIESDELAPGEEKCIERAHNGASADFTYTVTYPSGEVKTETFTSKYKAWQAVCLVGKAS